MHVHMHMYITSSSSLCACTHTHTHHIHTMIEYAQYAIVWTAVNCDNYYRISGTITYNLEYPFIAAQCIYTYTPTQDCVHTVKL